MKVLFVHPDLGVGGAERLIVDTALATKQNGHEVTILTNHFDPTHCFEDTKDLNIIVKASSLPRHLSGRFHAFFAYLKMLLASLWILYFSDLKFDIVICDQISLPVAVFKWNKIKVLFYCHFPDQLLCVYDKRNDFFKRIYRAPLDWLEMTTTGMADRILVNSQFTKNIFHETFASLKDKQIDILYPSLNTEVFDSCLNELSNQDDEEKGEQDDSGSSDPNTIKKVNKTELAKSVNKKFLFLSINRYERKKDLKLAIKAFDKLREKIDKNEWNSCHLIMAGGYDHRVGENINHFIELRELAKSLNLEEHVSFLRSISDKQKVSLLRKSFCLLYTPTNEHFGIVPIEVMYCERPVIATNTGGPLETIVNDVTGYLVKSNPTEFAEAMRILINDPNKQKELGSAARSRVIKNFSFIAFQQKLNTILEDMSNQNEKNYNSEKSD